MRTERRTFLRQSLLLSCATAISTSTARAASPTVVDTKSDLIARMKWDERTGVLEKVRRKFAGSKSRQNRLLAEDVLRLCHRQWTFFSRAGERRLRLPSAHKGRVYGVIRSGRAYGAAERGELDEVRSGVFRWPAPREC